MAASESKVANLEATVRAQQTSIDVLVARVNALDKEMADMKAKKGDIPIVIELGSTPA